MEGGEGSGEVLHKPPPGSQGAGAAPDPAFVAGAGDGEQKGRPGAQGVPRAVSQALSLGIDGPAAVENGLKLLSNGMREALEREEKRILRVNRRIIHNKFMRMEALFLEKPWLEERQGALYCRMEAASGMPPGVMGVGRVPVALRGENGLRVVYFTEQYPERVDIFLPAEQLGCCQVPLTEQYKASLQVEITQTTLLLRCKGSLEALVHGKLWAAANVEESYWEFIDDRELKVSIAKAEGAQYSWPHLLQNVPEKAGGESRHSNDPRIYIPAHLVDITELDLVLKRVAAEEQTERRLGAPF